MIRVRGVRQTKNQAMIRGEFFKQAEVEFQLNFFNQHHQGESPSPNRSGAIQVSPQVFQIL